MEFTGAWSYFAASQWDKPFGELRYTAPTYALPRYTFTGQYSYLDDPTTSESEGFGLMFYNARWYDPVTGRFAQADSIVPAGAQGLDRYAYVNSSPVNYYDSSGHSPERASGPSTVIWLPGWNDSYAQQQPDGDTCAPTSIASAMSVIAGRSVSKESIISSFESLNPTPQKLPFTGTFPSSQADGVNEMFYFVSGGVVTAQTTTGTRADLINNVTNGVPTVVTVSWKDLSAYGHALLVVGYDPVTGELYFMDPALGYVISETKFSEYGVSFTDAWLKQPHPGINPGSMVIFHKKPLPVVTPPGGAGGGREPKSQTGPVMQ